MEQVTVAGPELEGMRLNEKTMMASKKMKRREQSRRPMPELTIIQSNRMR
jgi:hypothetical protein